MELGFLLAALLFLNYLMAFALPRIRMERRARELLAHHPHGEQMSTTLTLNSIWSPAKRREWDAKVAEMEQSGWTFLRATEAPLSVSLRSRGGAVILHFIRP